LMGFSLSTATGQSGIFAPNSCSNVEIRNGTVRGFSLDGVSLGGGKSRVLNIRAFANQSHGIIVTGNGNQIRGCTTCNTTRGIFIAGGTLSGCTASDNSVYGIFCSGAASILNNVANNNTGHNFWFSSGSQKVLVDRNAADGLNPNYYITNTSTGVTITSNNVGTP